MHVSTQLARVSHWGESLLCAAVCTYAYKKQLSSYCGCFGWTEPLLTIGLYCWLVVT